MHSKSYLDMVFDVTADADEPAPLDADTWASKRGYECASRAAGGACFAVDMVMENKASTAFSLMRPPGHHAEPEQAMGFCLFSSAAICLDTADGEISSARAAPFRAPVSATAIKIRIETI